MFQNIAKIRSTSRPRGFQQRLTPCKYATKINGLLQRYYTHLDGARRDCVKLFPDDRLVMARFNTGNIGVELTLYPLRKQSTFFDV